MKDAEPLQGKAHGCVLTAPLKCEEGGSRMRTVSPSAREHMTIVPDSATMNMMHPVPADTMMNRTETIDPRLPEGTLALHRRIYSRIKLWRFSPISEFWY